MFRPGVIQPMHGERSKTPAYRIGYSLTKPLLPLLRRLLPNYILTTQEIARAMIQVASGALEAGVGELGHPGLRKAAGVASKKAGQEARPTVRGSEWRCVKSR